MQSELTVGKPVAESVSCVSWSGKIWVGQVAHIAMSVSEREGSHTLMRKVLLQKRMQDI